MTAHHDRPKTTRQQRTRDELAVLLEDALSAAAGWTVPPPAVEPVAARADGVNWTVNLALLDDGMRAAVRILQSRYELRDPPSLARRLAHGPARARSGLRMA